MSTPARLVLHAEIGQWGGDNDSAFLVPSSSFFSIGSTQTDGTYHRGNNFELPFDTSLDASQYVANNAFAKNAALYFRRFRIASAQAAQGLKSINLRKTYGNVNGFHLTFSRGVNSIGGASEELWTTKTLPQLNEWQDINQFFFPAPITNLNARYRLFLSDYLLTIDGTDVDIISGKPLDLRIELEVDA